MSILLCIFCVHWTSHSWLYSNQYLARQNQCRQQLNVTHAFNLTLLLSLNSVASLFLPHQSSFLVYCAGFQKRCIWGDIIQHHSIERNVSGPSAGLRSHYSSWRSTFPHLVLPPVITSTVGLLSWLSFVYYWLNTNNLSLLLSGECLSVCSCLCAHTHWPGRALLTLLSIGGSQESTVY